ncbi:hypothetical protein AUC61_24010 [Pseudomonas sp. S25]|uniref:Phage antitermination protein Q n=1 Tax=Pseudomonas maioricensis TaxID=1766623 RepID=A0ABS9ZQL6_9PSED|nr:MULTISPECIES: hypothetical protein [Pseudomonas]MCD5980546.1 hypothetical protein [Pseudomonas quasicaspiana]MCI8212601.1 hypothetical protein [Pseudomonas sp. S25]
MARRKVNNLDGAFELWARWSCADRAAPAGRSMLAKLIDNKGEMFFGGSGSGGPAADDIECSVEAAVLSLFSRDELAADVLRIQYNAAWWLVAARRGIEQYDPRGADQYSKAHALGISLRTYERRLKAARTFIENQLRFTA